MEAGKKLLKANARIYSNRNEFYAAVMTILMLIERQRQQSNIIFFDNRAPQAARRWTLYGKMGTKTRRPPSTHIPNKLEWIAKDIFIASSHSLHSTIVALVSAIKFTNTHRHTRIQNEYDFNIYLVLESALFSPPILSLQSNIRTSELCGIQHSSWLHSVSDGGKKYFCAIIITKIMETDGRSGAKKKWRMSFLCHHRPPSSNGKHW